MGKMNIFMFRNIKSRHLKIAVPVVVNHLSCAYVIVLFYDDLCQDFAASVVRSSLYKDSHGKYILINATKSLYGDF